MAAHRRLDAAVVEAGLAESRARAQALILGGGITVDGRITTKPSHAVSTTAVLALVREPMPYVSRGGFKLQHGLHAFGVDVASKVAVDVGASTGGFTDVLLQAGCKRVYAIDVGYGQLAWTLRNDPRVVVMERTNIRHVGHLPEQPDIGAIDVSFISLQLVLPAVQRLLAPAADLIALIKPQFEAGKGRVGRKGVVREPEVWRDVLRAVLGSAVDGGWTVAGLTRSPILGPAGNVEFLIHLTVGAGRDSLPSGPLIDAVLQ